MKSDLNRREFAKLTAAALGGVVAGAAATRIGLANDNSTNADHLLINGKNVCRGLNHSCANHKGGDNKCRGQGTCATAAAHTCHGANECKGEGGCGSNPGENACTKKGKCGVPLGDAAWTRARTNFEAAMTAAGRKFGDAPPKP